jgi:hypothetical protein
LCSASSASSCPSAPPPPPTSTAGAGFVNGGFDPDGPPADPRYPSPYPPEHTTFDLSLGKTFTDNLSVSITATKIANHRVLLDNTLTFGGFHYNDPVRSGQFHYRCKFWTQSASVTKTGTQQHVVC